MRIPLQDLHRRTIVCGTIVNDDVLDMEIVLLQNAFDELIKSVLEQDYLHIEHIIIDDGSTDDGATVEVLKRYPHLRWWSRENKGQYATLNEGLATARGSVVGIISADDK